MLFSPPIDEPSATCDVADRNATSQVAGSEYQEKVDPDKPESL